jgi:hypothetical protein
VRKTISNYYVESVTTLNPKKKKTSLKIGELMNQVNVETPENIHNRFEDINHMPLRVFNRVVTMFNLNSISKGEVEKYLLTFSEPEKKQMFIMAAYVNAKGMEVARKTATRGLELV